MTTIEEALAVGRGIERPFNCHVHGDANASASVNVTKMVWYCYRCKASGAVDSHRVPTTDELMAMLEPEKAAREYSESWLEVYRTDSGYWNSRFPAWLCDLLGFGEDPWTGEGTYPVHTPRGRIAGVCRRAVMPVEDGPKYRYPYNWSASRTLFGTAGRWSNHEILSINEGAADAASIVQIGFPAVATYGSGIHAPQVELVAAMQPRLILLGFDTDEAGQQATVQSYDALNHLAEIGFVDWQGAKDPAELDTEHRYAAIAEAVAASSYGHQVAEVIGHAQGLAMAAAERYVEEAL